ncbi:MAG TPA: hypothetical protein H9853_01205 [Candidatus Sphingobacterium stercoripullorum]|uniref:Urea transporter n=1 Tax=Candidatus Sphingobacterium stercoripullorum TaxID=2838759 RepID=A0A9D1W767_9SPHI|nr:hypothetical protein [Candidatus Sphingobacterium stercoripullorum]
MVEDTQILSPTIGWSILAILSVLWLYLGYFWGKKSKNLEGHMLAGRNVGMALGTATLMATWVTSNTTMLAPQFVLEMGVWGMLAYSTAAIGLIAFAPLATRIRKLIPKGFTSGDFIYHRYGKTTWKVFLFISLFYGIIWLISMAMAGGILMQTIAGIPYVIGTTVIIAVCVGYTLMGGLYAVIGTDYIQSLLILIGVVVVGIGIYKILDFDMTYNYLEENKPMLLSVLFPAALMSIFNNLLFSVGEVFHSNVWWSRTFALRGNVGKKAFLLSGLGWLPIPIAAGYIALSSNSLGLNIDSPDMVGPLVATHVLGEVGSIIVFIVLFCSLASSIDAVLASTADLITQDIYKKSFRPQATEQQLKRFSIIIMVAIGLLAWIISIPRVGTLASVLFFAGPMVGSTIWPIITGLFWEKANAKGALLAMLLGSTLGLVSYFTLGWYTSSLVGALVSMVVTIYFTKRSKEKFNWSVLQKLNS